MNPFTTKYINNLKQMKEYSASLANYDDPEN